MLALTGIRWRRIYDIAHRNEDRVLRLIKVGVWFWAGIWLALDHGQEGTQRMARGEDWHRRQKDGAAMKHWHLLRLFFMPLFYGSLSIPITAPRSLQPADNSHQIAVSAPLR
jgi:hypothetical protein